LLPEGGLEEGGGAAADEDGAEGVVLGEGCECGEFFAESVGEWLLAVSGVDEAVEIAVVALVEAEWDVDVEVSCWGEYGVVEELSDDGCGGAAFELLEGCGHTRLSCGAAGRDRLAGCVVRGEDLRTGDWTVLRG